MENVIYCPWEPATFLFVSSNVPLLIHYSHFIAIFAALAVSALVFVHDPKNLLSRLFLFFSVLFSTWAFLDVVLWATNDPAIVMFAWALQVLLEPLTYCVAFYSFYYFLYRSIPQFWLNLCVVVVLLPLIILLPTTLNLEALLLSTCESIEGPIAKYYSYILNLVFTTGIVVFAIIKIPKLEAERKKTALLFVVGLVTFLLSFTSGNVISSFTDDWTISQYGLFGMPVFAILIAYSIVRFNAFKIQIAGAQILIVVLWALVASLLFVEAETRAIILVITLLFTTIAGYLLIRSVRKEIEQREEIERLAEKLEKANQRLRTLDKLKSEFVSIASHQLRSPLTAIRGYSSMLLEGSFGKFPKKAKEALEKIDETSSRMAESIEDYLNVSRIESGSMNYDCTEVDVKELAENVADDLRKTATSQGLVLSFKSDLDSSGVVYADYNKIEQIIHNLLNNALKYTKQGSITVFVHDDTSKKKIYVEVIDTGIGMSKETIDSLFQKFERAHSDEVSRIKGSGLGLFVAREMAQGMKGDVTAHSEGEGKGSHFILELPLMKKRQAATQTKQAKNNKNGNNEGGAK